MGTRGFLTRAREARLVALAAVVATSVVACGGRGPRGVAEPAARTPLAGPPSLSLTAHPSFEVVDAVIIPPGTSRTGSGPRALGGLSAITPTARPGEYLVVSDEEKDPRLLRFRIEMARDRLGVEAMSFEPLEVPVAERSDGAATDFEGLSCTLDDTCYLSSEGNQEREPRLAPSLVEFRRGRFTTRLVLPEKFHPLLTGTPTRGVRRNEAFEGLTLTPDGRRLIAGAESTLVQDGERPTLTSGALARVLVFERTAQGFVAGPEYAYPLDAVVVPDGYEGPSGSNGLVELLPLSDGSLLTMERAFVRETTGAKRSRNHVTLYRTTFEGATDIRTTFSLVGNAAVRPMVKSPVLSLGDLSARLPPALANLENFEGMTVGPTLPTGEQTLLLMSDDNFSETQVTAFVLLRVVP